MMRDRILKLAYRVKKATSQTDLGKDFEQQFASGYNPLARIMGAMGYPMMQFGGEDMSKISGSPENLQEIKQQFITMGFPEDQATYMANLKLNTEWIKMQQQQQMQNMYGMNMGMGMNPYMGMMNYGNPYGGVY
jgi:hypothetical protein